MKNIHQKLIDQTILRYGIKPKEGNDEFSCNLIETVIQEVLGTIALHSLANSTHGSELREEFTDVLRKIDLEFEVDREE